MTARRARAALRSSRCRRSRSLSLLLASLASLSCARPARPGAAPPRARAEQEGSSAAPTPTSTPQPYFVQAGRPLCFAGVNSYYIAYAEPGELTDVLDAAVELGAKVVRAWAFRERGALDGSLPDLHPSSRSSAVYFQAWDAAARRPLYNDGPDGLERLDRLLHEARARGLLLVLVLTNGWRDYGGMDQYLAWYGLDAHHLFYQAAPVRAAYRAWVEHVVTRVNTLDGVPYRDDPAIFAWELANEPRTQNFEAFDRPDGWDARTIPRWAEEMSAHLRALDPNHLIAVGDEGFLDSGEGEWIERAPFGLDSAALTGLPEIGFGTLHFYPDHWAIDPDFGAPWLEAHLALGRRLGKPMLLEEYGVMVERAELTRGAVTGGAARRARAYELYSETARLRGAPGTLAWMLGGRLKSGELYPDFDQFTFHRGDATFEQLRRQAPRHALDSRACALAPALDSLEPSAFVSARPGGPVAR